MPKRIILDVDDTFDRVHGEQQLPLFNAYHYDYGFQPIVVFDGEGRFVSALLRPGKRPGGREIRAVLRRLVGAIRATWPRVEILLRADRRCANSRLAKQPIRTLRTLRGPKRCSNFQAYLHRRSSLVLDLRI